MKQTAPTVYIYVSLNKNWIYSVLLPAEWKVSNSHYSNSSNDPYLHFPSFIFLSRFNFLERQDSAALHGFRHFVSLTPNLIQSILIISDNNPKL